MRTTVDLPDDLIRAMKIRAAEEDRTFKAMVADLLRKGLAQPESDTPQIRHRVTLPLIRTSHPAKPGEELMPERISEIPLEQEASDLVR
jgi:plasmid stability protein